MIAIDLGESANSLVDITLGGQSYVFHAVHNSVNDRMYLSISQRGRTLIRGLKLLPRVSLLKKHRPEEFSHGELMIMVNTKDAKKRCTLGNIGLDKEYTLIYIPFQSEVEDAH